MHPIPAQFSLHHTPARCAVAGARIQVRRLLWFGLINNGPSEAGRPSPYSTLPQHSRFLENRSPSRLVIDSRCALSARRTLVARFPSESSGAVDTPFTIDCLGFNIVTQRRTNEKKEIATVFRFTRLRNTTRSSSFTCDKNRDSLPPAGQTRQPSIDIHQRSFKMAEPPAHTPSPQPDLNRNRLPTLFEVLSRRTLPPVDLFSFYIYMRDQQRSVDYLDFW